MLICYIFGNISNILQIHIPRCPFYLSQSGYVYIYIYIEDNCPNSYTWKIYPIQHRDMGCWWISNQEKNRGIQMVGKLETMPLSTIHLINSGNQHNTKITYAIPIISSYLIHNLWIRHDLYIYIYVIIHVIYIYIYVYHIPSGKQT